MLFSGVPRYRLIQNATPLEKMCRLGNYLGHDGLYIKRDDVMSLGMGGNKVRSIEFWLGEALKRKADLLIVSGAPDSNQCRLVAAAACRVGLECHILHNAKELPETKGNSLLNRIMGVRRVCLGDISPDRRGELTQVYAEERRRDGRTPYVVGDAATGALGYVAAALELHSQADSLNLDLRHIIVAGSMGTTEAGLLWGSALLGGAFGIHLPGVEYSVDEMERRILAIFNGISEKLNVVPPVPSQKLLRLYGDFLGEGYDIPTKASTEAIKTLASLEGIFVENTYNGKVFAALESLTREGVFPPDEAVCVVHTGGLPTLFSKNNIA